MQLWKQSKTLEQAAWIKHEKTNFFFFFNEKSTFAPFSFRDLKLLALMEVCG